MMKNKENYTGSVLPLYEVTELTADEALQAISDYREEKTLTGVLSGEALERYYPDPSKDRTH